MYLLGVDIGTSSTKSVLFDLCGNLISQASFAYFYDIPFNGYAEQDPDVWWDAAAKSIKSAMEKAKIDPRDIIGIGLSGQMHGMVAIDSTGNPTRKAILHCDVRAVNETDEIKKACGTEYSNIVCNPVFPGMQAISIYWTKKNEPESYGKIRTVICPKDYVRFKMTGKIGVEHTDASGTLLYDMRESVWSASVLEMLDLNVNLLPEEIHNSYDVAGTLTSAAAKECGLVEGIPVVFGGSDQAMHSLGNGVYKPGTMMATIGTSGQVMSIIDQPRMNPKLNTHVFRHVSDNTWFGLAAVLSAGSTLNWFRRNFANDQTFEELSALADKVPVGSSGLMFFPCMCGERTPYIDPLARGIFFGLSALHTKAHMTRSIMEGVSFAMRTAIEELQEVCGQSRELICAGGGVKGKVWADIQADIYGREITVSKIKEQACLGAAIVAGVGTGVFDSVESGCRSLTNGNSCKRKPREENVQFYRGLYEDIYLKLYPNNKNLFKSLSTYQ